MFLIRNKGDSKAGLSPEEHQQFLKDCEIYIETLKKNGNLLAAQPLKREGVMITGTPGMFREGPYTEITEQIVGSYRILASDLHEAIALAKGNPEFSYSLTAKIEIRPVKIKEETTEFVYPR